MQVIMLVNDLLADAGLVLGMIRAIRLTRAWDVAKLRDFLKRVLSITSAKCGARLPYKRGIQSWCPFVLGSIVARGHNDDGLPGGMELIGQVCSRMGLAKPRRCLNDRDFPP